MTDVTLGFAGDGGDTAAMPSADTAAPPAFRPGAGLRSPLSLAALFTWLAVVFPVWQALWQQPEALGLTAALGLAAQLLVLAMFVARALGDQRPDRQRLSRLLVVGQGAAALLVCACFGAGTQPVLLILVASQAAMLFPRRDWVLLLVLLNAGLAVLMFQRYGYLGAGEVLSVLAAYGGFQAFAVLVASYARQAEQARDNAQQANAELLATRQLLAESSRADERLRLSRELHDVAGHKLTALKLQLALLQRRAAPETAEALAPLAVLADELLADVRGVVGALRHHEGIDLHAALGALAGAFPQPRVVLELAPEARAPDVVAASVLLRVAQEALTNAARHSGAAQVLLRLRVEHGDLVLEVHDDGRGLRGAAPGNGLTGMRERVEERGGVLELADEGGLRVRARLPGAKTP